MTPCERLERWLDGGRPEAEAPELLGHAAGCARCRAALPSADALEAALRAAPVDRAPGWLLTAVMAEVEVSRRAAAPARPHAPSASPRALLWWSVVGLALGGCGFAAVTLLGPVAHLGPLPALHAAEALRAPGVSAALATASLALAGGLTWLSLKLTRAVEVAAMG